MMDKIALALFFIVTSVHLYASIRQDKALRAKTKPFILLTLLAYYCFSAEPVLMTVVLALIFSWIGDVLLIPHGNKWFTAGGISFMISHFFFVITYARMTDMSRVPQAALIVLPKALFWPMLLYLLINGSMNCFAWFRSMSSPGTAASITAIGALLFYISDTSLFFVRFNENGRLKTHFLVMLTYSLGEFLIVLGLILH